MLYKVFIPDYVKRAAVAQAVEFREPVLICSLGFLGPQIVHRDVGCGSEHVHLAIVEPVLS